MSEDEFQPRLGRPARDRDVSPKSFLNRIHAASRGVSLPRRRESPRSFVGGRVGRGAGVGHVMAANHPFDRHRARRVVVKVHIARASRGVGGALRAHVRCVQRDGVERDGSPGALYDRASDSADGKAFIDRSASDRHQFRLVVSPEDADELDNLKGYTRDLMERVEGDLGTRLDWVAVDHFNTDNPHTHIVIRGREPTGKDLVIAKDYLTHGLRRRASELATDELGPRRDNEIAMMQRHEVEKERLTTFDRELLAASDDGVVDLERRRGAHARFRRTLVIRRLQKLEALGLAEADRQGRWKLSPEMEPTLRRMGERGDIVRGMARAFGNNTRDFAIFDPADPAQREVIGRVIGTQASDELYVRRALIVDAVDGRTWHVDIGEREPRTIPPDGAIVALNPRRTELRQADRTIAQIASMHGGHYSDALHAQHDPLASSEFRRAHKRRLEALRRDGIVVRDRTGEWTIPPDYLAKAAAFEAHRTKGAQLHVHSWLPVERLVDREAATWLDREANTPIVERGFGATVATARLPRRAWLLSKNVDVAETGALAPDVKAQLQRSELRAAGAAEAARNGKAFVPANSGERIDGTFTKTVDLAAGRFALVERSKEFTLVPWRPALEGQRGRSVSGVAGPGGVDWDLGRKRGLSI
ncbi:MAG: DUF3363 domain-containing protein [Pseudomonadota bacterium]